MDHPAQGRHPHPVQAGDDRLRRHGFRPDHLHHLMPRHARRALPARRLAVPEVRPDTRADHRKAHRHFHATVRGDPGRRLRRGSPDSLVSNRNSIEIFAIREPDICDPRETTVLSRRMVPRAACSVPGHRHAHPASYPGRLPAGRPAMVPVRLPRGLSRHADGDFKHRHRLNPPARWSTPNPCANQSARAGVAELADAVDSKSTVLTDLWVRPPPPAPSSSPKTDTFHPLARLSDFAVPPDSPPAARRCLVV